jgi:hypothetical protein
MVMTAIAYSSLLLMRFSKSETTLDTYRSNETVSLIDIPKEQIFSEEVDSTWVDELGITHKTFKQNNYEFE